MSEFQTVEQALKDLQDGKLILVTDDENRENEGDFICAAQFATTGEHQLYGDSRKGIDLHADVGAVLQTAGAATDGKYQHGQSRDGVYGVD